MIQRLLIASLLASAALGHLPAAAGVIAGTGQPDNAHLGASQATRLVLSPAAAGHILLLPYFNVQGGNATIFSVTNHDSANGKALKIRLRGGSNGDALFDVTVLLAPRDTWTAVVRAGASGVAELATDDLTCTVPRLTPGQAQTFFTRRLPTAWDATLQATHTREGHAEIITMADIPQDAVYGTSGDRVSGLFTHIRQTDSTGPLCGASAIDPAVVQSDFTTEAAAAALGLAAPTGGISGRWTLINVPRTTTFSGVMPALAAVNAAGTPVRANFALFRPVADAYSGNIDDATADPLLRNEAYASKSREGVPAERFAASAIAATHLDLPDLSTPYTVVPNAAQAALQQATQASAALATTLVRNDYAIDVVIEARTDWTFSMPMRRYSVAMDYGSTPARKRYSMVPTAGLQYFHDSNVTINPGNAHQVCYDFPAALFFDRLGREKASGLSGDPFASRLCGVATVMSFADVGPSVLSGTVARIDTYARSFVNGWAEMRFSNAVSTIGVPMLGHAFIRATNPAASPGVSGTYGLAYEHQVQR